MTTELIEFDRRRRPGGCGHNGQTSHTDAETTASADLARSPLLVRHILAPLDGSPLANCTVPFIAAIARAFSARVTLLRVMEQADSPSLAASAPTLDWELARAEAYSSLSKVESVLKEQGCEVAVEIVQGRPAEQIVHFASREGADLIVLASHGAGGLHGWNLASTAYKVVCTTHASVLVVPARRFEGASAAATGFHKLLVPLDCSPRAECILPAATELAKMHGAELILAHVVPEPEMPRRMPASGDDQELADELVRRNRREAEHYLRELQSRLSASTPGVEIRILTAPRRTLALRNLARQEGVDLVLLCAHGSSGDPNRRYGGVASKFLQEGEEPVLVLQDFADIVQPRVIADTVGLERPGH